MKPARSRTKPINGLDRRVEAQSNLGRVGHAIEPAVRPLGWDCRIGTALAQRRPARG